MFGSGGVQRFSPDFFYDLYTSRVVVTSNEFPHSMKREGMVCLNTWHGFGFKNGGRDAKIYTEERKESTVKRHRMIDIYISNNENDTAVFRGSFGSSTPIYDMGSPRNDILFDGSFDKYIAYDRLGIDHSKKIVLYAPTFRDDVTTSIERYAINAKDVVAAMNRRFGGDFVFVYRLHPLMSRYAGNGELFDGGVNATSYLDQQELLVAADVLISDYSSIMWDFALQRRPVFVLHNDIEQYERERGFYFPPEEWPYVRAFDSDGLCQKILDFDEDVYLNRLEAFIDKYKSYDDGHASDRCCDLILSILKHPEYYQHKCNSGGHHDCETLSVFQEGIPRQKGMESD